MRIGRTRPTQYVVEFHAYELAQLMAAARWALETGTDQLPSEASSALGQIVASYDEQIRELGAESASNE